MYSYVRCLTGALCLLFTAFCTPGVFAQCVDNVVLVHGNVGHPTDWDSTYQRLLDEGYTSSQIFRPSWGSKICPACNNHSGSEEVPVRNAINTAINSSCTGKIDVIGHSMGVTLAAKAIISEGRVDKVDAFIGIAGAYRGLWSCGRYPFNVTTSTCGQDGLSVSSPFLDGLHGKEIASRVYSIKSYTDQVVCGTGVCTVGGVHSSRIEGEVESFTFTYGHFGLQKYTASKQYALLH